MIRLFISEAPESFLFPDVKELQWSYFTDLETLEHIQTSKKWMGYVSSGMIAIPTVEYEWDWDKVYCFKAISTNCEEYFLAMPDMYYKRFILQQTSETIKEQQ